MNSYEERQALVASIPWVTRYVNPRECSGYRWSSMPLKAVCAMGGKPPVGRDKWKCRNVAYWRFRALKRSHAQDGVYCWQHLFSHCLYGDMIEEKRINDWLKRNDVRSAVVEKT